MIRLEVKKVDKNGVTKLLFKCDNFDYKSVDVFDYKYIQIRSSKKTYSAFEININQFEKARPLLSVSVTEVILKGKIHRPIYTFRESAFKDIPFFSIFTWDGCGLVWFRHQVKH